MLDTALLVPLSVVPIGEVQGRSTSQLKVERLPLGMNVLGALNTVDGWKLVLETSSTCHYVHPLCRTEARDGSLGFVLWLTNAWYWVE